MTRLQLLWVIWIAMTWVSDPLLAAIKSNTDESKVPSYTLPDPLTGASGEKIASAEEWTTKRRPEILRLFETEVYGKAPAQMPELQFHVDSASHSAIKGKAILKEVTIRVSTPRGSLPLHLLLFAPKDQERCPAFLGLNFLGNQAVHSDPAIALSEAWILAKPAAGIVDHRATEASRGDEAARWQVESVISRGYALATMCCGDIDPDFDDGFQNGVHPLFYRDGQAKPDPDQWGTIAAWAWGLSRALDYLATDELVDAKRVAVIGHSRLGKTALWAAATDPRFAMAISNNSGCGGAALSKRIFGETVGMINKNFPHWFCGNFHKYGEREDQLPVDQHMLIALVAPRPVYVASAVGDKHADPLGEFLATKNAEPVYRLFGKWGLGTDGLPPVDHPVGNGALHYHMRTGKHDITAYDWEQYLNFADAHLHAESDRAPPKSTKAP